MRTTFFFTLTPLESLGSIFAQAALLLTLIGIIIGVASVVLVEPLLADRTYVLSNVTKQLGANTFYDTQVPLAG
jgi:hypothetical protein